MKGQSVSLFSAIFSTTIWTITWLAISSILGIGLGWLLGQSALSAAISKRALQFLTYCALVSCAFAGFFKIICMLLIIALFATTGVQKAKESGNQWHFLITDIFLGVRLALILLLMFTQMSPERSSLGLGNYIYNAYNNGDIMSLLQAMFSILILVILFNQALGFLEKLLLNRFIRIAS